MSKFKNLFIYVSDALRYDYLPKSIGKKGKAIKTLTPALYTPISFSSLVSGLEAQNHNVRCFRDTLDPKIKTVFDLFENHCYYDHPNDPMCKNVFKNYDSSIELTEIEEPFVWIERALDTHEPYGKVGHGGEIPKNRSRSKKNKIERYKKGVKSTEEHFWSHVEELEERGIKDETLIIFTSDHGELFGKRRVLRKRYEHNIPMTRELAVVPTVFLNAEVPPTHMRTIDIIPTALDIIGKENLKCDGRSILKGKPGTGESIMVASNRPLITGIFEWVYKKESGWGKGGGKLKNYLLTLLSDFFGIFRKIKRMILKRKKQKIEEEIKDIDI